MNGIETRQVTTPSATEIVMTRTFAAPRQLVFDAFTKPELIRRWLGRRGDEMIVCDVDLRVGGAYRYVWRLRANEHGRRGERGVVGTFRELGTFREVDPPERVVCTESFDDYPGETARRVAPVASVANGLRAAVRPGVRSLRVVVEADRGRAAR